MEKLFSDYEKQSKKVIDLLKIGIEKIQKGYSIDDDMCSEIGRLLSDLHSTYNHIRSTLSEHLSIEEMPEDQASVYEYAEKWRNSFICKQMKNMLILNNFIRVYSEEQQYMSAIEPYINVAKEILKEMETIETSITIPDISQYELFLNGISTELTPDSEITEKIWDSHFSPRVVRGLLEKKYHIHETENSMLDLSKDTEIDDTGNARQEMLSPINEIADEMKIPVLLPEPGTESDSESPDSFIHPIHPIKSIKLPSDQKLKEIIKRTSMVLRILLNDMVFPGMMDEDMLKTEEYIEWFRREHITKKQISEMLQHLENKGLICIYEYEHRRILCFTNLMESCLKKQSLSSLLKRELKLKSICDLNFIGLQNLSFAQFTDRLEKSDLYYQVFRKVIGNSSFMRLLPESTWDKESQCFFMNLAQADGMLLPMCLVSAKRFSSCQAQPEKGILCYADTLPEMDGVTDEAHYCLTSEGLYQWKDDKWNEIGKNDCLTADADPLTDRPDEIDNLTSENESDVGNADAVCVPCVTQEPTTASAEEEYEDLTEEIELAKESLSETEQHHDSLKSAKGLWLDDLSEVIDCQADVDIEVLRLCSSEVIAGRLLECSANGSIPSDESMAVLIHQMLQEGASSYDAHHMHDQVVEVLVLAKTLSSVSAFPLCKSIYEQLNAAIPLFEEDAVHTGLGLTNIFSNENEFTPAARFCAYLYGMLFPSQAHDYTFHALCESAFWDYEQQFPGLEELKTLYHKALTALQQIPNGFSPSNLAMLSDSNQRQKRMDSICARARGCLNPPTVKQLIRGMPDLISMCFGNKSDIYTALMIVSNHAVNDRELVQIVVEQFTDDNGIDREKVERYLDTQWKTAAQNYPTRKMEIRNIAGQHLQSAFIDRLQILQDWLNETESATVLDLSMLRAVRDDVLKYIETAITGFNQHPETISFRIIDKGLSVIYARLTNRESPLKLTTMLRSGALVIDGDKMVLNDKLNQIPFAEPWRMMLRHIACTDYDLFAVYNKVLQADASSVLYDNLGQLEAIGRFIGADPKDYILSEEGLRNAAISANTQANKFREKLEISYAYHRISEKERERLAMLADARNSEFREFFYAHRAFGCWRGFLNALCEQIRISAQRSIADIRSQLEHARMQLLPDEESPLLTKARDLIEKEQKYSVAEEYIHRFQNGEKDLPFEATDSTVNHYLEFLSEPLFKALFDFCEKHKNSTLSKASEEYISIIKKNGIPGPQGWTTRNYDDAQNFLEKWPTSKQNVYPQSIGTFFRLLGLDVRKCEKFKRENEICFTLSVRRTSQNQADYRHPIAMLGTQMKPQLDVVCLFGFRTATQLVNDVCKLKFNNTFVVLLDATLTLSDRRKMAEYIFTQKNVGQASFLVIDRILALYLAMQTDTERLPAMLQCTLPYTIYQPFTNGSGSTADEMFFGRVRELATIRDMTGTTIVYGGRQLGKTALLERVKHLDNNPERHEYAVMVEFKECRSEKGFVEKLTAACNEAFQSNHLKLNPCVTIQAFADQIQRLLKNESITVLRLLLDETDMFLDSISGMDYSPLQPLINLQRNSDRRFKFVLAGLHNVCRAKNATRGNGIFGQLGAPLCVKPLTAAEAQNLLLRPLRYLGFNVLEDSHVAAILVNTNYYPGIIQYFGYTLVQTLASQYSQYYSVQNNPPFELRDELLASIMNSKGLNDNVKERLRWTLEMDMRYYMLARCIAVLYHLSGNNYAVISKGFDIITIREIAIDMFEIPSLAALSESETVLLLDEMEEMGILSRTEANDPRYLLRRRSFIDVIGPSLEIVENDIKEALREEMRHD